MFINIEVDDACVDVEGFSGDTPFSITTPDGYTTRVLRVSYHRNEYEYGGVPSTSIYGWEVGPISLDEIPDPVQRALRHAVGLMRTLNPAEEVRG